jgi:DNA-binding MarR family transcriptional regulator
VARLARTSANLDGMRRWGYVTLDGAERGGGARRSGPDSILRLTAAGRRASEIWAPLPADIAARWETRFGSGAVDRLREALNSVGETFPGLPDTLPILRYGLFCEADDTAGPSAGESSVGAQLSRPLLAFARGYERGVKLSLAVMLNVVRVLDGDGVRVTELPGLSGVSREAIAMALKLLANAQCVEIWSSDRRRMVRLTDRGLNARRRGLRRLRDREAAWQERFGDELRTALAPLVGDGTQSGSPLFAGLEPYPDGWRADVHPPGRLPWFPMVLHRGGWPDGS